MKRSRAFRPTTPTELEGRVVLSQVFFSPVTGIIAGPGHAETARAVTPAPHGHAGTVRVHEVDRTRLADGKALTTATATTLDAAGKASTVTVTREPDGTTRFVDRSSTTSDGTTAFTKSITLPGGAKQVETGTDQARWSTTTILPDGTLQANPSSAPIASRTTTFDHVIAQAGLGAETIVGTTVRQDAPGRSLTVTDQDVTHFDGSKDRVQIVTIGHGRSATIRTSTTPEGGATITTVRTSRVLSSTTS